MSSRSLVVLGTASQVPTRHRNHNGYFVSWDGFGVLFDPGEGTQRQMELYGVASSDIHHVAVTHFHGDHCLGLPGLLQRFHGDRVAHSVTVTYPGSGQRWFDHLEDACIYERVVQVNNNPLVGEGPITSDLKPGMRLIARQLDHRVETWGYRLQEDDGVRFDREALAAAGVAGKAVGQLLREGEVTVGDRVVRLEEVSSPHAGQSFAFVMDTRPCAGALALAKDVDLLVIESTFLAPEAELARKYGHLTATEAARIAVEAGAKRVVLAHFSRRYGDPTAFAREAGALHPHVHVANDGDRIAFATQRLPTADVVLQSGGLGTIETSRRT